jgi:hypothetical protein
VSTVSRRPAPDQERRRYQVVTCGIRPPQRTAAVSSSESRARTLWRWSPALRFTSSQVPGTRRGGSRSSGAAAYWRRRTRSRQPFCEAAR